MHKGTRQETNICRTYLVKRLVAAVEPTSHRCQELVYFILCVLHMLILGSRDIEHWIIVGVRVSVDAARIKE
jgi:hypothetical protein